MSYYNFLILLAIISLAIFADAPLNEVHDFAIDTFPSI